MSHGVQDEEAGCRRKDLMDRTNETTQNQRSKTKTLNQLTKTSNMGTNDREGDKIPSKNTWTTGA